jgi:hypothetical protein
MLVSPFTFFRGAALLMAADLAGTPTSGLRRSSPGQRPRTIAAYRDTVLLIFVHRRSGKPPTRLGWDDLDVTTISAFLNHLESDGHDSVRTRNVFLTAIPSLFSFAALATQSTPGSSSVSWRSPRNGSTNASCPS